jgi:hypothetical protein
MATRYVQDVSAQTDKVIENSRQHVLRPEDTAWSKLRRTHERSPVLSLPQLIKPTPSMVDGSAL